MEVKASLTKTVSRSETSLRMIAQARDWVTIVGLAVIGVTEFPWWARAIGMVVFAGVTWRLFGMSGWLQNQAVGLISRMEAKPRDPDRFI